VHVPAHSFNSHARLYFSREYFRKLRVNMPAYLIARVQVTDWERYRKYTQATPAAIEKYRGRFIVRGGETVSLEGPPETGRLVVIEFPSLGQAKAFYHSPEYSQAKKLREGAATGQFILVEGWSGVSPAGSAPNSPS
jgi:uncharacterized protein (DUF1330 family)